MADAEFGELAGAAAHGVLVAIRTSPGVKDRSQAGAGVVCGFVDLLIERIGIAGGFRDAIAVALGTRILHQGGSVEACRRFGGGVLGKTSQPHSRSSNKQDKHSKESLGHQVGLLRDSFLSKGSL